MNKYFCPKCELVKNRRDTYKYCKINETEKYYIRKCKSCGSLVVSIESLLEVLYMDYKIIRNNINNKILEETLKDGKE